MKKKANYCIFSDSCNLLSTKYTMVCLQIQVFCKSCKR